MGTIRSDTSFLLAKLGSAGPCVFDGNEALRKGFILNECEVALREAGGKSREPSANQNWHNAEVDLVDEIGNEKITRQFAATRQPDVFTFFLTYLFDQAFRALVDENETVAFAGR